MEPIQVRMLGGLSLQAGENRISDSDSRTKKVWLLLAYLLCQRGRPVTSRKLIEILWGPNHESANPDSALRITFHRARNLLDSLWPDAGRELIRHKDSGYFFNGEVPVCVDADRFEALCEKLPEEEEARLAACLEAVSLYRGEFLEKQSSEVWVIPISTHYHNLYIRAVLEAASLLEKRSRFQEAVTLCRNASAAEPYHEPLHQIWIRQLGLMGDREGASEVYDSLSKRLFDDFGIRPSPETRDAYRAAVHTLSEKNLPMDVVLEHLQEAEPLSGAMECDYDYFKVLCYAQSRAMERSGKATHIVLLSVSGGGELPLSKRTVHRIMGQLGEQIRKNLRRGDIFSRCSVSQYIVMLPEANYENSCMVSRRILGAFQRAHPHVSARIHYMVQPLSPVTCVP